jgi:hypothetical protein
MSFDTLQDELLDLLSKLDPSTVVIHVNGETEPIKPQELKTRTQLRTVVVNFKERDKNV